MNPKDRKLYNKHFDDVQGDFLRPPHGTTPASLARRLVFYAVHGIDEGTGNSWISLHIGFVFCFSYELGIFHANRTTMCLRNQGRTKGEGWSTAN